MGVKRCSKILSPEMYAQIQEAIFSENYTLVENFLKETGIQDVSFLGRVPSPNMLRFLIKKGVWATHFNGAVTPDFFNKNPDFLLDKDFVCWCITLTRNRNTYFFLERIVRSKDFIHG